MRPVKQKQPRIKNKKITDSARGEDCTLRISGVCNFNPETTVFAHMNGGGMGYKHHDIHGCYACSKCHSLLDSAWGYGMTGQNALFKSMIETQNKLIEKGLIKI